MAQRVYPKAWESLAMPAPLYVRWRRFITPSGFFNYGFGVEQVPAPRMRYMGAYTPPPGSSVVLNFSEALNPPPGGALVLEFGSVGYGRILGVTLGIETAFGTASLEATGGAVKPSGIAPGAFGKPSLLGSIRYVSLNTGIPIPFNQVGTHYIRKGARDIAPKGFAATEFSDPAVWLYRRFISKGSIDGFYAGTTAISLKIRTISPPGADALGLGSVSVINTQATQAARPDGIGPGMFGDANVSPRILYAFGFMSQVIGAVSIHRNPSPEGFDMARFGTHKVEQGTRYIAPAGRGMFDAGYPRVKDRAFYVQHIASPRSAVFGDVLVRNINAKVRAEGWDSFDSSPWSVVDLRNRTISVPGIDPALSPRGQYTPPDLDSTITLNSERAPDLSETVILPRLALYSSGHLVKNAAYGIYPAAFSSLEMGRASETSVGEPIRYIRQAGGVLFDAYGTATISKHPEVAPSGFSGEVGTPAIWPAIRSVFTSGSETLRVSAPTVWFGYRYVRAGGADSTQFGRGRVEHDRRFLLGDGMASEAYGIPRVSHYEQTIAPESVREVFASNHVVGTRRWLRPVGFDAARFGARIIPEILHAYPFGFSNPFGTPSIDTMRKSIAPSGFLTVGQQPEDRWGTPRVFNLRQYVCMFYDVDSELNPPAWPNWTLVENRDRTIRAIGRNTAQIGYPILGNQARLISPIGAEPAEVSRSAMIAYRLRPLKLEGIEAPYMSGWARIYNDGRVLAPAGIDPATIGKPSLEKTRRYYRQNGFDSAWLGYPTISERIRTVSIESRYGINPPIIPLPEVKLFTRYVEPRGLDAHGAAMPFLEIHWTKIWPRWTLQNFYGSPIVRNLTPELGQRGRNSEEFGDPSVRLQWRQIETAESYMTLFGRASIADKRRTIHASGLMAGAIGDKIKIIKSGTPPYSTQTIDLSRYRAETNTPDDNGFGIPAPDYQVGTPVFNQQVVYVVQAGSSARFGTPFVSANSIRVEPGYQELTVGEPSVSLKIRTLTVSGFPNAEVFEPSNPRVSPHTIYAVMDAPEQAKANHPTSGLHYVDGRTGGPGAVFGSPAVENRHRGIGPTSIYPEIAGIPVVFNRKMFVSVKGIQSLRFGWHVIPGPATVEIFEASDTMEFGEAAIDYAPHVGPRTLKAAGYSMTQWGAAHRVENFNRFVSPIGYDAAKMGESVSGDAEYLPQHLNVGPRKPVIPDPFDSFSPGVAWVSLRVRGLSMDGFDAFISEYQLEAFAQRMRVRNATTNTPARQQVRPTGIDGFGSNGADLRLAARYIRPDGNADQLRKGAF
jgi:hypothetical protein